MSEHFVSGYCRQLDAARMVEIVLEHGEVEECDCAYGSCKFQTSCPIAKAIEDIIKERK